VNRFIRVGKYKRKVYIVIKERSIITGVIGTKEKGIQNKNTGISHFMNKRGSWGEIPQ
jgi:hypothetical protein